MTAHHRTTRFSFLLGAVGLLFMISPQLLTLVSKRVNVEIPSADLDLIEMGIIDSLTLVDLLLRIEEEFGVRVPLEELKIDDLRSVAGLARVISRENGK